MTRLEKLKELEANLHDAMNGCEYKELASISKQYRETIREIDEIEGTDGNEDEIAQLLTKREADGKPGAVRKDSSKV
jgi:hypothetical protein